MATRKKKVMRSAAEKLAILDEGEKIGTMAASAKAGISNQAFYQWRQQRKKLEAMARRTNGYAEVLEPSPPPSIRVNGVHVDTPPTSGMRLVQYHLQCAQQELDRLTKDFENLFGGKST